MKRIMLTLVLFCLGAIWADVTFSQVHVVKKGDRVRITLMDQSTYAYSHVRGDFIEISGDHFKIAQKDSTVQYPMAFVRKLEINTGSKRRTGRGALIGAASGGFLFGIAAMGSGSGSSSDSEDPWGFDNIELFSSGESFLIGFTAGALLGGGVGAIIGSTVKTEKWELANWQLTPLAYSDGKKGAALRIQIRF
jgi:outer membrane lipoprotein SlyB